MGSGSGTACALRICHSIAKVSNSGMIPSNISYFSCVGSVPPRTPPLLKSDSEEEESEYESEEEEEEEEVVEETQKQVRTWTYPACEGWHSGPCERSSPSRLRAGRVRRI